MLSKLLKYEFKATARSLIPLYLALITISFIEKIFMEIDSNSFFGGILLVISTSIYAFVIAASFVVTLVIIIKRFRKNLLLDEGYLMNTLPVKPWENIMSKLILAIFWSIVSGIVGVLSVFILVYENGIFAKIFTGFYEYFSEGYTQLGILVYIVPAEFIIFIVISLIKEIALIYASICIGNLLNKRKVLGGFGAYIGINTIESCIVSIFNFHKETQVILDGVNGVFNGIVISSAIGILTEMVLLVVYFCITNYILKNRLNLQ